MSDTAPTNRKVTETTPQFVSWYQTICDRHAKRCAEESPKSPIPLMSYTVGPRYIKIVRGSQVHAFIDKSTGGVLKPAGWNAPAKHERGNIFNDDNGLNCMGPYGPAYLR